jgi:hypothetical protein
MQITQDLNGLKHIKPIYWQGSSTILFQHIDFNSAERSMIICGASNDFALTPKAQDPFFSGRSFIAFRDPKIQYALDTDFTWALYLQIETKR